MTQTIYWLCNVCYVTKVTILHIVGSIGTQKKKKYIKIVGLSFNGWKKCRVRKLSIFVGNLTFMAVSEQNVIVPCIGGCLESWK